MKEGARCRLGRPRRGAAGARLAGGRRRSGVGRGRAPEEGWERRGGQGDRREEEAAGPGRAPRVPVPAPPGPASAAAAGGTLARLAPAAPRPSRAAERRWQLAEGSRGAKSLVKDRPVDPRWSHCLPHV